MTETNFFSLVQAVRPEIEAAVQTAYDQLKARNASRYPLDDWLIDEAARRTTLGKLMRGGIVVVMAEALGYSNRRAAVQVAAALEIYGTAILMQDDVMDESSTRRGLTTIHVVAAKRATEDSLANPAHVGESLANCLADVLYFLADGLIAELEISPEVRRAIQRECAWQLQRLGMAQVEDLRLAASDKHDPAITREHILAMMSGKTAHYSICWPLALACALAETDERTTKSLQSIGEQIGILFQLRDDELGLIGDPAVMGKSNLSDLREGKKTLYWLALRDQLPASDPLWNYFGNPNTTDQEILELKEWMQSNDAIESAQKYIADLQQSVAEQLGQSGLATRPAALLSQLLTFVLSRQK